VQLRRERRRSTIIDHEYSLFLPSVARLAAAHGAPGVRPLRPQGQYRHQRLLAEYDSEITMPDLRHLLARCPRRNTPGMSCGVYHTDLMRRARADDAK
jgi:hypothetical protein